MGERLYVARRGSGATRNGEPISVSGQADLQSAVMDVEGRIGQSRMDSTGIITALSSKGVHVLRLRSFTYAAALVATGQLLASVFTGDSPWDAAAASLLVSEAGGRATDLQGNDQRYDGNVNGLVVSNGMVHDELLAVVAAEHSSS